MPALTCVVFVRACRSSGSSRPERWAAPSGRGSGTAAARDLVALDGRSARTRRLAAEAGLEDVGALVSLLREAEVVLSVVPPEAAVGLAPGIAAAAALGGAVVADLNAVSPGSVARDRPSSPRRGSRLVDGAISGPPPARPGTTRVYLSGRRAEDGGGRSRSTGSTRRRGGRARPALRGEDVHGVRLQGPGRRCSPRRFARRAPTASSSTCSTISGDGPRRPRPTGATLAPGIGESVAVRRARWRRSPRRRPRRV